MSLQVEKLEKNMAKLTIEVSDEELDKAIELDVPIVGVAPWGQERVSKTVSDRAKEVVRWNTESIVAAIRKWAK